MKEISQLQFPDDVFYSPDHEWARIDGGIITVGIDDFAQDQMGDIVYVELPEVGDSFDKDDEFGTVESVKAVSEIFMPLGGEIVAVNSNLEDSPELINQSPYGDGWLIRIQPDDESQIESLLEKGTYMALLKETD